jgi:lysophospholipase L1-like esterase
MTYKHLFLVLVFLVCAAGFGVRPHAQTAPAQAVYKFDFGPGPVAAGDTPVLPDMLYSPERGFGFEPGAAVTGITRSGPDARRRDFVTSDQPFYFSVALPAGNYRVTVTLGDAAGASTTTVKAELRRLMLEKVSTARGKFATHTFIVNVRTPQIAGGGEVRLKEREKTTEWWAWDEKLTLEFNHARPALCALAIEPADVPTVFLLGDSTVCDQPREPYNSWGQMLPRFFKPEIAIANHAESGESLKSSLGARRLDKVLSLLKPGDYLFIQYGHNDQKEKGEGSGAFTSYKADLQRFVAAARARGGVPVLVTSMLRLNFDANGQIVNTLGDYPAAVRQVAREAGVPLLDLFEQSKLFYEALGPARAKLAFKEGDATHHNNYGSYQLAQCIVSGIRASRLKLAQALRSDLPPFNPRQPAAVERFAIPPSPLAAADKPLGN